jgi:hypothetical protein
LRTESLAEGFMVIIFHQEEEEEKEGKGRMEGGKKWQM